MINLMKIKDTVEISLPDEFLIADNPLSLGIYNSPTYIEKMPVPVDFSVLDGIINDAISKYKRYDTAMDACMAREFHRALPIPRRYASDSRFWAWLGILKYPDFVAWRWAPSAKTGLRTTSRFYGDRVRQTFSRLWWAAELTRSGDDYTLTKALFDLPGFQDIYEAVFGRAFGNYQPALIAFVEVVGRKSEKYIRDFAKELGYVLTTSVLETMSKKELVTFMQELDSRMSS